MGMTTSTKHLDEAHGLGVDGFLVHYSPASLSEEEWAAWRTQVTDFVLGLAPGSRNSATVAASLLCDAIKSSREAPGTDLSVVLRDEVIDRVTHARRQAGQSDGYAREAASRLQRFQAAALGLPPRQSTATPKVGSGISGGHLAALRVLATSDDEFISSTARNLLTNLDVLRPHRWLNPLPADEWRKFRTSSTVQRVAGTLRWDKLRSERVWEEAHRATPAIDLITHLNYNDAHWKWLLATTRQDAILDVQDTRGGIIESPSTWTVKGAPMSVSTSVATSKPKARRKVSKAEARRIAREHIESLATEPEPLTEELEALLEKWAPKGMPEGDWLECRNTVHDVMRRSHIRGLDSFRKHLRMVTEYVSWAIKAGYPENIAILMSGDAINDYSRLVLASAGAPTASTTRSKLRAVGKRVNPEGNPHSMAPEFQHRDIKPPYTEEELVRIETRISLVTNPTTRRAIQAAVALGLGAGLSTGDLQKMTRNDIEDFGEDGMRIAVPGPHSRTVWLRRDQEEMLRAGISLLSANGRVLGLRHHKDTIRDLYRHIQPTGNGPTVIQSRLRHTWIARLMCEPIPLVTLMRVAGLATARTLTELAPYIHPTADERDLRGVA